MKNPITIWQGNRKAKRLQDRKDRILKQKEPILDAFAENIKGAKLCPLYMGQKCVGILCEFYSKYETLPDEKGNVGEYFRCSFNQIPSLQIEQLKELRINNQLLVTIINILEEKKKQ